jgi:hypothetical protein
MDTSSFPTQLCASEPRLPSDPARDRRAIRFLGSIPVRACSLPQYDYVLFLVNDYFQYDSTTTST